MMNIAIIDEELLSELVNLGQEIGQPLVEDLLRSFKVNFPHHVRNLQIFASKQSFVDLEHTAHALKGSAAALGALRVQALCETIEHKAVLREAITGQQIQKIQEEISNALISLENLVEVPQKEWSVG